MALQLADLIKYNKEQLKVMRNEVFARYVYAFLRNERMRRYFTKKEE